MYDIFSKKWTQAPSLCDARIYSSSCQVGNSLYTFGGTDGVKDLSNLEVLDVRSYLQQQGDHSLDQMTRWKKV